VSSLLRRGGRPSTFSGFDVHGWEVYRAIPLFWRHLPPDSRDVEQSGVRVMVPPVCADI
jgi:hypothetical protein